MSCKWLTTSLVVFSLAAYGCAQTPQQAAQEKPEEIQTPQPSSPRKAAPKQLPEELKARITQLLRGLADEKYLIREQSHKELKKTLVQDTDTFDAVLSCLKSCLDTTDDVEVRIRLKKIIGNYLEFGITSYLLEKFPDIVGRLGSPNVKVRCEVVEELGDLKHSDAVDTLVRLLRGDSEHDVRVGAVEALGKIGDARAVGILTEVLKTYKAYKIRVEAANSLAVIGGKEVVEPLLSVLRETTGQILRKRNYVTAWYKGDRCYGEIAEDFDIDFYKSVSIDVARRIVEIDNKKIDDILRKTFDSEAHPITKLVIAHLLYQNDRPLPLEFFRKSVRTDTFEILRAYSLWHVGDREEGRADINMLIEILCKDKKGKVRAFAAEALGKFVERKALGTLHHALENDRDDEVKYRGAIALGRIGDSSSVKPLLDALKKPVGRQNRSHLLAGEYLTAIGRIGDREAVQPLMEMLKDGDRKKQHGGIISTLGMLGGEKATAAIKDILRDESMKRLWGAAAAALATLEDKDVDELLLKAMKKSDDVILLTSIAWRKGGKYLTAAKEKVKIFHGFFFRHIKAHWGDVKSLEKCLPDDSQLVESGRFGDVILKQMPEWFPQFDARAGYHVRRRQAKVIRKWYEENKDRLAWDKEKRRYYLKPDSKLQK
jgi:HEAT repeat protein